MHYILSYVLNSAIAQFGVAGLVLSAAIFVYIEAKNAVTRHAATAVVIASASFLFMGTWLYNEGVRYEKAQWDAAEEAARMEAVQAREEAEKSVAADSKPNPSRKSAKRLRNDRNDRDNH